MKIDRAGAKGIPQLKLDDDLDAFERREALAEANAKARAATKARPPKRRPA